MGINQMEITDFKNYLCKAIKEVYFSVKVFTYSHNMDVFFVLFGKSVIIRKTIFALKVKNKCKLCIFLTEKILHVNFQLHVKEVLNMATNTSKL